MGRGNAVLNIQTGLLTADYFAGPKLQDITRRHNARVVFKPYDFQAVAPKNGGVPLRTRPDPRQDYHAVELDRWRRYLGMPLNLKPRHYPPSDNKIPGHTVIAARQQGLDAARLSHAILRALWAEERDVSLPQTRVDIANDCSDNKTANVTSCDFFVVELHPTTIRCLNIFCRLAFA